MFAPLVQNNKHLKKNYDKLIVYMQRNLKSRKKIHVSQSLAGNDALYIFFNLIFGPFSIKNYEQITRILFYVPEDAIKLYLAKITKIYHSLCNCIVHAFKGK